MTDKRISRLTEGTGRADGTGSGLLAAIPGAVQGGQGDVTAVLQQASKQIERLTSTSQLQADYLLSNTQALGQNTASKTSPSNIAGGLTSAIGGAASSLFGDTLSLLPLVSGIAKLFGGGPAQPEPLMRYIAPPPVQFRDSVNEDRTVSGVNGGSGSETGGTARSGSQPANQPITIHVNALDSKSIMDRSHDIAQAVREAMLNMHSINDVVNDL